MQCWPLQLSVLVCMHDVPAYVHSRLRFGCVGVWVWVKRLGLVGLAGRPGSARGNKSSAHRLHPTLPSSGTLLVFPQPASQGTALAGVHTESPPPPRGQTLKPLPAPTPPPPATPPTPPPAPGLQWAATAPASSPSCSALGTSRSSRPAPRLRCVCAWPPAWACVVAGGRGYGGGGRRLRKRPAAGHSMGASEGGGLLLVCDCIGDSCWQVVILWHLLEGLYVAPCLPACLPSVALHLLFA